MVALFKRSNTNEARVGDLVYLNSESLNNHLASIGAGIELERVQSTTTGKDAKGSLQFPNLSSLGISAEYHNKRDLETKSMLLDPHRFYELVDKLDKLEREVKTAETIKKEGKEALSRGDIIEVKETLQPMALFTLEIAMSNYYQYLGDDLEESIEGNDMADAMKNMRMFLGEMDDATWRQCRNKILFPSEPDKYVYNFMQDLIAMKISIGEYSLGIPFIRSYFRETPVYLLREPQEFTIYGRVEQVLDNDDKWYPSSFANITAAEKGDEYIEKGFRKATRNAWNAFFDDEEDNIQLNNDDIYLSSPAAVVHPIGMYW